jgi:hypothetical protein
MVDEGRDEMKQRYRFEIVCRGFDRFGWILVVCDEKERRVLARSVRSYRSKDRVREAIAALKEAPIEATKDRVRDRLPETRFQLVRNVLPLRVGQLGVACEPEQGERWREAERQEERRWSRRGRRAGRRKRAEDKAQRAEERAQRAEERAERAEEKAQREGEEAQGPDSRPSEEDAQTQQQESADA